MRPPVHRERTAFLDLVRSEAPSRVAPDVALRGSLDDLFTLRHDGLLVVGAGCDVSLQHPASAIAPVPLRTAGTLAHTGHRIAQHGRHHRPAVIDVMPGSTYVRRRTSIRT